MLEEIKTFSTTVGAFNFKIIVSNFEVVLFRSQVSSGLTVLVIAHRLSTVRKADKIIVIGPGGQILEHGTHLDLMDVSKSPNGVYRKMLELQQEKGSPDWK